MVVAGGGGWFIKKWMMVMVVVEAEEVDLENLSKQLAVTPYTASPLG